MAIPKQDAALAAFAETFSTRAMADPQAMGLTPQQAANVSARTTAFVTAYADVCEARASRTDSRVLTLRKQTAKAELLACARALYAIVRADTAVGASDKINAGVPANVRRPSRRGVPAERPTVLVRAVDGRTVTLDVGDPSSRTRLARPDGTMCAVVYCAFADEPPAGSGDWRFCGLATRPGYAVTIDAPPGTLVWFTAAWANRRGQLGPSAQAVSTHVGGGIVSSTHGFRVAA